MQEYLFANLTLSELAVLSTQRCKSSNDFSESHASCSAAKILRHGWYYLSAEGMVSVHKMLVSCHLVASG